MSILNIFFGAEEQSDDLLSRKRKEYDRLRERLLCLEREILEGESVEVDQEEVDHPAEEHLLETTESQSSLSQEESSSVNTSSELVCESGDEYDEAVFKFFEDKFQQVNSLLKDLYINKQEFSEKDSLIKDLHKELQGYKGDLYKQILSPILLELISWTDKIRNTASYYHRDVASDELPGLFKRLLEEYEKLSVQVEDILYNFDVEPYSSKEGEPFNVKRHKAVMTESIADSEKDKTIKSNVKVGYMDSQEKIIRKEEVVVYKYENNR